MKKAFILMMASMALSMVALSPAQERKAKPASKPFVGKVTQVNARTSDVTMVGANGEKLTLNFANPRTGTCPAGRKAVAWTGLPKVGDVLVGRYSSECEECLATC